jgi:hypothetical protein
MTTPTTLQTGASIWAVASRLTPLDAEGNLIVGAGVLVTRTLVKGTMTIVYEPGDAVAIKDASGELSVFAIHGDIPKWGTAAIEFALPDPQLEYMLTNGIIFNDTTSPLGDPTAPNTSPRTTLGSLVAGTYYYGTAAYTAFGRSLESSLTSVTISTGTAGRAVITPNFIGSELGAVVYGRGVGVGYQQEIGRVPNIGSQATAAASGTGVVTTLTVAALTKGIPQGTTFTIAGDTNSPQIVFTVTESASIGQTEIAVSTDQATITTTIASSSSLEPVFVDNGTVTPSGVPNTVDRTGGPGLDVGFQMPGMGANPNPNGFALEMWQKRIIDGDQASDYPYWWHVWPKVKNMHVMARDFTNANLQNQFEGNAFPNPNFGSGPNGDFPFDSSQIYQRFQCGPDVVPTPSQAYVSSEI